MVFQPYNREDSIVTVLLVLLTTFTSSKCDCIKSFTWVSKSEDNPNFWKSPSFGWNSTEVLGVFGDITSTPERMAMRDYAQQIGVKVQAAVSPADIDMSDTSAVQQWIDDTISYVKAQGLDGINVDYEGNNPKKTAEFNNAVASLCETMHAQIPGSSISVDVPIYPEYEERNYDYARLAEACDTLFIMGYDGQFWDNVQCALSKDVQCSNACSPIKNLELGIQRYIAQGVPASSMYLGLAWYGLMYEKVAGVPFFTGQIHYSDIQALLAAAGDNVSLTYDDSSVTWKLDCGGPCKRWTDKITDRTSYIWFDDPKTLAAKNSLVRQYGLRGGGMWEATHVTYDDSEPTPDADAMWGSMCQ